MSLYNMVHGMNPLVPLLLALIGTDQYSIPRFRDCYMNEDGEIVVHTRTGGGNRSYYESEESCRREHPEYFENDDSFPKGPWNEDLRKLPGYLRDEDSDYDSTYANFYFKPEGIAGEILKGWQELIGTDSPETKWKNLFTAMERGRDTPEVARALEAGKPVIEAIIQAFDKEKGK